MWAFLFAELFSEVDFKNILRIFDEIEISHGLFTYKGWLPKCSGLGFAWNITMLWVRILRHPHFQPKEEDTS